MGIFNKIFKSNSKPDWNTIKQTEEKYPKESYSLLTMENDSNQVTTGWVNKGYKNYQFKEFCPICCIIYIDNEDMTNLDEDVDMSTIEDYFFTELNTICVTHIVSRIVTPIGLEIFIYTEKKEEIAEKLNEMYNNTEKLVEFGCEINIDSEWTTVYNLLEI